MEEVKELVYLGFKFTRDNGVKEHMKDRIRKARQVMGIVWGLGERRMKNEIGRERRFLKG